MFLINSSRTKIINLNNANKVVIVNDGCSIKVEFVHGLCEMVEKYNTRKEAETAVSIICESILNSETIVMPTEQQIKAKMITYEKSKERYNGQKVKSHGAS